MRNSVKKCAGIILYSFSALHILTSLFFSSVTAVWFDEVYSMVFAFRPAKDLIALTARDVHPPLYYLILRVFLLFFNKFLPFVPSEQVGKLVSTIPYILLMVYAATKIRKKWGFFVSGLFSFFICFMPEIMSKTIEIRMYSWAALFITGLSLKFVDLISDCFEKKRNSIFSYIVVILYSVAALYTHYFAAIAVFWLYFFYIAILIIDYIKGKASNNTAGLFWKKVISIVGVGIISIICYIPWISVVLSQVSTVKESYWIWPIGPKAPYNTAMFLFKARYKSEVIGVIFALVVVAFLFALLCRTIRNAVAGDNKSLLTIYIFSVLPFVALTGYILSIAIRPIFLDRYLEPSMGPFWLSISVLIVDNLERIFENKEQKKYFSYVTYCVLAILCADAIVNEVNFCKYENNIKVREKEFLQMLSLTDEDTILITNLDHIQGMVSYMVNTDRKVFEKGKSYKQIDNRDIYLYMSDEKPLLSETLPGFCYIEDGEEIKNFVSEGKKVLLLNYVPSVVDVPENLTDVYGLTCEFEGSYLFEHYDIDVYSIGL